MFSRYIEIFHNGIDRAGFIFSFNIVVNGFRGKNSAVGTQDVVYKISFSSSFAYSMIFSLLTKLYRKLLRKPRKVFTKKIPFFFGGMC